MWKQFVLPLVCAALLGCGGNPVCTPNGFLFGASPATSTNTAPDHVQKSPGNQEQFLAYAGGEYGPNCATPAVLAPVKAQWTVADPKSVSISSASDDTNGLATCLGTTAGAVAVTATYTEGQFTETGTTTITCR